MRASTMADCRLIAFEALPIADGRKRLIAEIVAFVSGVRGKRQNPVSESQVVAYFRATDPDFVRDAMQQALVAGKIRITQKSLSSSRRSNGAYRYTTTAASFV